MSARCPFCGGKNHSKIIYLGLPGRFCLDCALLFGPASYLPIMSLMPARGSLYEWMVYEGGYLRGLWQWLAGRVWI